MPKLIASKPWGSSDIVLWYVGRDEEPPRNVYRVGEVIWLAPKVRLGNGEEPDAAEAFDIFRIVSEPPLPPGVHLDRKGGNIVGAVQKPCAVRTYKITATSPLWVCSTVITFGFDFLPRAPEQPVLDHGKKGGELVVHWSLQEEVFPCDRYAVYLREVEAAPAEGGGGWLQLRVVAARGVLDPVGVISVKVGVGGREKTIATFEDDVVEPDWTDPVEFEVHEKDLPVTLQLFDGGRGPAGNDARSMGIVKMELSDFAAKGTSVEVWSSVKPLACCPTAKGELLVCGSYIANYAAKTAWFSVDPHMRVLATSPDVRHIFDVDPNPGGPSTCHAVVQGLTPLKLYQARIARRNALGWSKPGLPSDPPCKVLNSSKKGAQLVASEAAHLNLLAAEKQKREQKAGRVSVKGRVHLDILEAYGLIVMDSKVLGEGSSDPYVKVLLGPGEREVFRTKIQKSTLDPVWNESCVFEVKDKNEEVVLALFDGDIVGADDPMGRVKIQVSELAKTSEAIDATLAVNPEFACPKAQGQLHVRAAYSPPNLAPAA